MSVFSRSSRRRPPSWADHVPRRGVSAPPPVVWRSAVAVLTASALAAGTVYTASALTDPDSAPATVLGLAATGACDEQVAARQLDTAAQARAQARALLTDLTVSEDPDAAALASKIRDLGYVPVSQPDRWRQAAVDTSDQLHRLDSTDPHLQEIGVRLAAAGLGPTPADLLPPASSVGGERVVRSAPPLPAACTDPAAETDAQAPAPVLGAVLAVPQAPVQSTDVPAAPTPAPADLAPPAPPASTAPTPTPATGSGSDLGAVRKQPPAGGAAEVTSRAAPILDGKPSTAGVSGVPEARSQSVVGRDSAASSVDDVAAVRAAVSMVGELMQTITAAGDDDATQVGLSVLDALDRDHLASLGADPADLDALDRLRTTTSGVGSDGGDRAAPATADTVTDRRASPAPSPTSDTGRGLGAGESITRAQAGDSATTGSNTGGRSTQSEGGSVSSSIEKLTEQARAAAEVDPAARDLLDALDNADLGSAGDLGTAADRSTRADAGDGDDREAGGQDKSDDQNGRDTAAADDGANTDSTPAASATEADDATGDDAAPPEADDSTDGADGGGVRPSDAEPADGSTWDRLAQCGSSGDWSINSGNGYHGGLQFSPSTWKAYGGSGAAHEASRDEQIAVAERVQAAQGWKAWPACSKRLGLR